MLRVKGESMIEAGILNDDYVLVKQQNDAINGDIVVALIEDEATIKRFFKEEDHVRLQPENQSMSPPILVKDILILGKVIGSIEKFRQANYYISLSKFIKPSFIKLSKDIMAPPNLQCS